ncbi:MAG: sporulation initiation factor Spo0A C-terminal domain-containing protein [Eubacterium sp.]|nr:sporulation initiation factor Spo0A C-terminal domain-containing protein [Eubacterium sp.]
MSSSDLLLRLGITPNLKGYRYGVLAINMVLADESLASAVTKEVYPEIARTFKTTPTRAERAIRHAIEVMMLRADNDFLLKIFGSIINNDRRKPTNSEFIATLAEYIRLNKEA